MQKNVTHMIVTLLFSKDTFENYFPSVQTTVTSSFQKSSTIILISESNFCRDQNNLLNYLKRKFSK